MEIPYFASELILILQEVIQNHNVQLFNQFVSNYLEVYIKRLTVTELIGPGDDTSLLYNSDIPELLSILLLDIPYNEEIISEDLKKRYLVPWSQGQVVQGPPNGCYTTDDQGQILIETMYDQTKQGSLFYRSVKMTKASQDLFPYLILTLKDGSLMAVHRLESSVVYWQCPNCKAYNSSLDYCTSCRLAVQKGRVM